MRSLSPLSSLLSLRQIKTIVPATSSGPINRLVGTVDIDGKGTNHPLDYADPILLLDQGTIPKHDLPPFGKHPHRGHSVGTILFQGKERSWDSFTQVDTIVQGPAIYWVDAASGVFHDETTVIEDESDPSQHIVLYQCWVSVKEQDRQLAPKLQYNTNLPVKDALTLDGSNVVGSIRYYVGGGGNDKEKTSDNSSLVKTLHPIIFAHISQHADTTFHFPIDTSFGGIIVNLAGCPFVDSKSQPATFSRTATPTNPNDVLVLENPTTEETETTADANEQQQQEQQQQQYIEITTCKDAPSDYLICIGERIGEPWYKKLVANGAVIAQSPEEAREIAKNVETYAEAGKKEGGSFAPFGK